MRDGHAIRANRPQAGGKPGTSHDHPDPSVSVVVLNHKRPHLLARVLGGIAQIRYDNFEVVVVGDQPTLEEYGLAQNLAANVRYRPFQKPNICWSRNIGIEASAGEIVAFIDDDAVPEPNWLRNLVLPFQAPTVGAVAGSVWAANGVTLEWQGGHFDRTGTETPHKFDAGVTIVDAEMQRKTGQYLSLMGVNTAFRRQALLDIGGFDQAYRYFLDETDVALRLAEAGWDAALSTAAEVHHLREENAARDRLRAPRSLFEISASTAYFCSRHAPADQMDDALMAFRQARLADLDPFIRLGLLRSTGRRVLVSQMDQGLLDGAKRKPDLPLGDQTPKPNFHPFRDATAAEPLRIALVSGWGLGPIRRMRRLAERLAAAGHHPTCISFLSGPQARTIGFMNGVWVHTGGTWRMDQRAERGLVIKRRSRAVLALRAADRKRQFDVVLSENGGFGPFKSTKVELSADGFRRPLVVEHAERRGRTRREGLPSIAAILGQILDASKHTSGTSERTVRSKGLLPGQESSVGKPGRA